MKNIKKIVALALGGVMSLGLFTGCSKDSMDLYKAFSKSQSVTSMTTKTDMTLKVSAQNLSAQEKQVADSIIPMINNSSISMTTKTNQNKEKTKAQVQSDIKMNIANMPLDMALWMDTDLTGEQLKLKEIVKLPSALMQSAPEEFKGKEYLYMDYKDIANIPGAGTPDFKKVTEFSKDLQEKLVKFISKYAMQFNPKTEVIAYKGPEFITQQRVAQLAKIYEIKLDDKGFKELLRYTVNNFAQNNDVLEFIKEYMNSSLQFAGLPEEELNKAKEEMDKAFQAYEKNLPQFVEKINATFDGIKDIKILGEKGIAIQYAVGSDGYIINEKGVADFVIDLSQLDKLNAKAQENGAERLAGVYNFTLEFNSDIYNINEYNDIQLPELNEKNSVNYMELINTMVSGLQKLD
ncbi:hypothetical protein [Desnuesiella massiliensis]|uniref:hypothetical protein n=1 Tax=Desnuesiella massiliensis TaxID=1650662 RepID=UPI0006E444E5|nr:hypothetical protein [Desnuesiella massiliensis]